MLGQIFAEKQKDKPDAPEEDKGVKANKLRKPPTCICIILRVKSVGKRYVSMRCTRQVVSPCQWITLWTSNKWGISPPSAIHPWNIHINNDEIRATRTKRKILLSSIPGIQVHHFSVVQRCDDLKRLASECKFNPLVIYTKFDYSAWYIIFAQTVYIKINNRKPTYTIAFKQNIIVFSVLKCM